MLKQYHCSVFRGLAAEPGAIYPKRPNSWKVAVVVFVHLVVVVVAAASAGHQVASSEACPFSYTSM